MAIGTTAAILGASALGAGASLYGANKQAQSNRDAQKANAAQQDEQNRLAWANYLMTRGVDPTGAQTGEIPKNAKAINARLPLYATLRRPVGTGYSAANQTPQLSVRKRA